MNQILMAAIRSKELLAILYHEHTREIEVYAYGATRLGDEVALCFQTAGGSESGEVPGWKLLKVEEISSIRATGVASSEGEAKYAGPGKGIAQVYLERH